MKDNNLDNVDFLLDVRNHHSNMNLYREGKHKDAAKVFQSWCNLPAVGDNTMFETVHHVFMSQYKGAEYHDWYHTCCMIHNCCEAYVYERGDKHIDQVKMNSLLLAAAFHDAGHLGGREPDGYNVSRAVAIAVEFMQATKIVTNGTSTSGVDKNLVIDLIQITQYPFKREPVTDLEKIIRDCDLLQILEPTWFEVIYENLFIEVNRSREMTFAEFCKGQKDFLHNAQFYSNWWNEKKFGEFGGIGLERACYVENVLRERNDLGFP